MDQQLKFYKGIEPNLENVTSPEVGAIYHCEDTGNTYLVNEARQMEKFSSAFTFSDDVEISGGVLVNADTLGGLTSSAYAKKDDIDDKISAAIENLVYIGKASEESYIVPTDADSLGGITANQYATKDYVAIEIGKAQMGGGSGGEELDALDARLTYVEMMTGIMEV